MKILTLENRTYTLERIPEYVDEQLRFAVMDNSDPENPERYRSFTVGVNAMICGGGIPKSVGSQISQICGGGITKN